MSNTFSFELGKGLIMGILNYTPDSFSDGGLHNTPETALKHALLMKEQGADIIDIGCNSTRPGCKILSEEEELERAKEVIPIIASNIDLPISIDTFYVECARYALENGVKIINDVSGTFNEKIAELVKQFGGGYIVMHNPVSADVTFKYPDGVMNHIIEFFEDCINKAKEMGLSLSQLCIDPGLGFSKTNEEQFEILANCSKLKVDNIALLIALSRKRFLRFEGKVDDDFSTCAANTIALCSNADLIRVHNVFAASQVRKVVHGLNGQNNCKGT